VRRVPVAAIVVCILLSCACRAADARHWVEMVPMRDGTKLETEVYLPKQEVEEPLGALLHKTCYSGAKDYGWLAEYGYAVVVQYDRGQKGSEGDGRVFVHDGLGENLDGYDAVEWVAGQSWCSGKVGTFGASGPGIVQVMMGPSAPPHLACQFIVVAGADLYRHAAYPGGVLRKAMISNWLAGFDPINLQLVLENRTYNAFWEEMNAIPRAGDVACPVYNQGGWFDCFAQGTVDYFVALSEASPPELARHHRLVMGPWTHGYVGMGTVGEITWPEGAATAGAVSDLDRWAGYWLRADDNGIPSDPRVTYYTMGAVGEQGAPGCLWRTRDDWPPAHETLRLYLQPRGGLRPRKPGLFAGATDYAYDPADPCPTRGGANLSIPYGPMDQRPVEERSDVLVFSTEPLSAPLEVTGRLWMNLAASTDAADTDFAVRLCDVYPDGRSMLLADGIIRARHRISTSREDFVRAGKAYRYRIDLWSTSYVFNEGHRVRVSVTSSNDPRFEPNPNNGLTARDEGEPVVAGSRVHHSRLRPSWLELPVPLDAEYTGGML